MPVSDPYAHAIRQAAHDAVRALVSAEPDPAEGVDALRDVVSWLARCYGPDALRDLAEELAADLADGLQVLAAAKGLAPQEMADAWFREDPRPEGPATAPLPIPARTTGSLPASFVSSPLLAPERRRSPRRPRSRWW